MDPFSITVGAVGLADAGTSLAGFLTDKYRSYRDAPELILEVAHEVEFCAGLVDMFADSVDRADVGGKVPKKFVKDARGLVERTQIIFRDILELIPEERDFDGTFSRARWRFALDKKKLTQHQQRLRQAQQMFLFMESMYRYRYPVNGGGGASANDSKNPNATAGAAAWEQSLTGVLASQIPIQATSIGPVGQNFEVTLTLKPVARPVGTSTYVNAPEPESKTALPTTRRKREKQGRSLLEGLRRSPFFDTSLLAKQHTSRPEPRLEYQEIIDISEPSRRKKAETAFFGNIPGDLHKIKREEERMRMEHEMQHKEADKRYEGKRWELEAVDGVTAQADVEDLNRRWFGDSDDEEEDASLGAASPEASDLTELAPLPPAGRKQHEGYGVAEYGDYPAARAESVGHESPVPLPQGLVYPPAVSTVRSPFGTESLTPHSETLTRPNFAGSQDYTKTVICDGCDKKIRSGSPRQQCRDCEPSFDLCAHCFANPEMTLRHRHPKSYFLRSTV